MELLYTVKEDAKKLKQDVEALKRMKATADFSILVGIPEETTERESGEMSNAELLYIHTNGSPALGLPPRPLIEPCLTDSDNAEKISADLGLIADAIMSNDLNKARGLMEITGQDAVNMIKDWFVSPKNNWLPNSPATVKRKLEKTSFTRAEKADLFSRYQEGEEGINTVLVDTAQLRNSITYVVKEGE